MRKYFVFLPLFLFLFLFSLSFKASAACNPADIPKIPVSISPTTGNFDTPYQVTIDWKDVSGGYASSPYNGNIDIDLVLTDEKGTQVVIGSTDNIDSSAFRQPSSTTHFLNPLLISGDHTLTLHLTPPLISPSVCSLEQTAPTITLVNNTYNPSDPKVAPAEGASCLPDAQDDGNPFACPTPTDCYPVEGSTAGKYKCLTGPLGSDIASKAVPPCTQWVDSGGKNITPDKAAEEAKAKKDVRCISIGTAIGNIAIDPKSFVTNTFSIVLGLAGGIALILIILAGYRYMVSQGNPEAVKAANEQLTAAIVGLLFIIFSFVILRTIGVDILQIPSFPTF